MIEEQKTETIKRIKRMGKEKCMIRDSISPVLKIKDLSLTNDIL